MIGRQLAHFKLLEEIGSGAMGVVYRAHDLTLHRVVAVKTLVMPLDEERRRRFLAEARAASALNHPSIVTIYEVGTDGDVDFIAMELVEGRSLAKVLADGPLDLARAHRWSLALARALAVAHRAGVVHRDVKPANVMVRAGDELKVLDFGLAKRLPSASAVASDEISTIVPLATAPGAVLGTPAYMSPEQATGREAGPGSDLFSFGCVVYEMLTGRRPFEGRSAAELMRSLAGSSPTPRRAVPGRRDARRGPRTPTPREPGSRGRRCRRGEPPQAGEGARRRRRRGAGGGDLVVGALGWSARRGADPDRVDAVTGVADVEASFPDHEY